MALTVEEVPLPSGRMTPGVVRVGDTVRRPTKPSSPFVARLLIHLERRGCEWAPRYLGEDELGRDILSFLPGATPVKWGYFCDEQLQQAAGIIRQLHELTRESDVADGSVVCHHDPRADRMVETRGAVYRSASRRLQQRAALVTRTQSVKS